MLASVPIAGNCSQTPSSRLEPLESGQDPLDDAGAPARGSSQFKGQLRPIFVWVEPL